MNLTFLQAWTYLYLSAGFPEVGTSAYHPADVAVTDVGYFMFQSTELDYTLRICICLCVLEFSLKLGQKSIKGQ